ncbi:MAG: hypothetical protein WA144_12520 [Candidatus Methanoperedens sp.]
MIIFKELFGNIQERNMKIQVREARLNSFLVLDERSKVVCSPEKKQEAAIIAVEIKELRQKNDKDAELLEKSTEISKRLNIPLDEMHQFSLSIPGLQRQVTELEEIIKEHKRIDPKLFEHQRKSKHSPFFQKEELLKQARKTLENHIQAEKELSAIMKERKK